MKQILITTIGAVVLLVALGDMAHTGDGAAEKTGDGAAEHPISLQKDLPSEEKIPSHL